jgi:hypothetical protein
MFSKKNRKQKTLKHYVSDIDRRLAEFDHTHRLSPSQQAEIKKYEWIYKHRDNPIAPEKKKDIWKF